jgi:FkbM family methyltransferase
MEPLLDIMGYLGVYRTARQLRNRYLRPELGDRSRALREFYSQFIRPGDLVFDIGANQGDRTEIFVQMGARVVAVEPQPALAARLRTIFRYSPVNIEAVGVGSSGGTLPLHVCSSSECSSFSEEFMESQSDGDGSVRWVGTEIVPIVTADSLIDKYGLPAFVKIDVEGFEGEVLAGLTRAVPSLSFEVRPQDSKEDAVTCLEHVSRLCSYEFNMSLEESLTFQLPAWGDGGSVVNALREVPQSHWRFGDVYARRIQARSN